MTTVTAILTADALADGIREGSILPSAAMGRADAYTALVSGKGGKRKEILGTSLKIEAGERVGVLTRVLYMVPANGSGREACPGRSAGCTAACLAEGVGRMSAGNAQAARRWRHAAFYADRGRFLADVDLEIRTLAIDAMREGMIPAVRLNGTTDLPWHRMPFTGHDGIRYASLHAANPGVRFYEYTKHPLRIAAKGAPSNLSLTFSLSDHPDSDNRAAEYLAAGRSVAVVIRAKKGDVPSGSTFAVNGVHWLTVDGDTNDVRFLDPPSSVVTLSAKGKARGDDTGFVRDAPAV